MPETWLRTNRRAILFGLAMPAALALVGACIATGFGLRTPPTWAVWLGWALVGVGCFLMLGLVAELRRPRLAYDNGQLLVNLQSGVPIRVPVDVVECFFFGQAPSMLPGRKHEHTEASTVVVRLAEAAKEWEHREVNPSLGSWCASYITIRGTWCEPLNLQLVNQLNARLAEVHRQLAATTSQSAARHHEAKEAG